MTADKGATPSAVSALNELRDLSDFCMRWSELKVLVDDEHMAADNLAAETKLVVAWLRELADRVTVVPLPQSPKYPKE